MDDRVGDTGDIAAIGRLSRATGQTDAESGADAQSVEFLLQTATVKVVVHRATASPPGVPFVRHRWARCSPTCSCIPTSTGRGMGGALLRALWPEHRHRRFTFSSQHASALPLYARAGLQPSWPLLYLSGQRARLPESTLRVEQVQTAAACAADSRLASGNRCADYAFWTRAPSGQPLVVRDADADRIVAAGALRGRQPRPPHLQTNPNAATALTAALHAAEAHEVTVCLPGPHPALIPLLRTGFRMVDYDLAMSTPDLALPVTWAYSPGAGIARHRRCSAADPFGQGER